MRRCTRVKTSTHCTASIPTPAQTAATWKAGWDNDPRPGDAIVYGGRGHVGIVLEVASPRRVLIVEGNAGRRTDRVSQVWIDPRTDTGNGGRVDGVLAANDGLAGAVITVLTKYGLNGQVPVTGQDATADGLQAILRGDQYMTVYKPIKQEADAAAKLAAALAKGDTAAADALATQSVNDPEGARDVKSVLLEPQLITRDNVKTVVDDGAVPASDICVAETAAACQELGISAS